VALDLARKRLLDSALPNDEAKLERSSLNSKSNGRVLLVVANCGSLKLAPGVNRTKAEIIL
jgi:hypothetical protein